MDSTKLDEQNKLGFSCIKGIKLKIFIKNPFHEHFVDNSKISTMAHIGYRPHPYAERTKECHVPNLVSALAFCPYPTSARNINVDL